ncbi:MAG: hypothetical protein KZQ93_04360 [Candidatus Thiodiazotropha sp. (ex Monitilora ramsayi)]|nr:hypothetical protein [Candidatus Thiodiazotropha sp. (ex Monitilora ramsayi)]
MNAEISTLFTYKLRKHLLPPVFLLSTGLLTATAASAGIHGEAGVACQKSYENGWQTKLNYAWNNCSGFKNEIGNVQFYYNLAGAEPYWETSKDQYEPETVDIYYSETHGGAWANRAVWAMWDDGSLASSNQMMLGNENQGLSILSTYSCETLKHDDIIGRYDSVMAGGLRYTTGSHDKFYDGWTTDEVGEDYADNLNDGDTIRYAWRDGVSDWYHAQDATVMTTGTNAADCSARRSGMRWTNYNAYARRTSGNIGYYCWTWWNNL